MKTNQPKSALARLMQEWKEAEKEKDAAWQRLKEFAAKNQKNPRTWEALCHYQFLRGPVDKQLFLNRLAGIESPPELEARSEHRALLRDPEFRAWCKKEEAIENAKRHHNRRRSL